MWPSITIALAIIIAPATALLGYDCGGEGLNITTLSLTEIEECETDNVEPETTETYIQLLQRNEYDHVQATQCRIEIDRQIFYCGMHSHISAVSNGKRRYLLDISRDACSKIRDTGSLSLGYNTILSNIKVNETTSRSIALAGSIRNDGECTGATYSDVYGTWDKVVVQASVTITIKTFLIAIHAATKEAVLPSGTRCRATKEQCPDDMGTPTFWTMTPRDQCEFNRYDVLYEGPAHKMIPRAEQTSDLTIYSVATRGITFALTKTMETNLCGYTITHTEHPKLFVLETQEGRTFKAWSSIHADNLDIFTYVNLKFVYVENHLKTQLSQLYRDVMAQKCALEKQVLEDALSLASIAPDEMAYRLMKTTGYTAFVAGEVIYIIKCTPVECRIRHTDLCYDELPVTYKNTSYFIKPRSRILTQTGTVRECSDLLPAMYRIRGTWFRMAPRPMETLPPPIIKPLTKPTWRYINPEDLATSGIYSPEDLEKLRSHIMFPVEKPSVINNIAQGVMGGNIPTGTIGLHKLLDEESLEKIAKSAGLRLWKGFITFGSFSAGLLSVLMIFHLGKLVINSIIRGYALHSIYGWSMHILGAIWSTVTNILLYKGHTRRQREASDEEERKKEEGMPLQLATTPTGPEIPNYDKRKTTEAVTHEIPGRSRDYGELNKYLPSGRNTIC